MSKFIKVDAEPITYCLQPLLAVQNLVNPSTETSTYISQLHMIQRLKNYSNARLYCEVIRACMMCLHDVTGSLKESHWGGFTVLKLPQILKELHASTLNGMLIHHLKYKSYRLKCKMHDNVVKFCTLFLLR